MKYVLSVLAVSLAVIMMPNAFAESVPDWVKNTSGWWATDVISETEFVNAIEFLVKKDIIQVDTSQTIETSQAVPEWVKNTAGWWATNTISETEFVNAIAYLINVGIINIESSKSPELIAEMWMDDHITDDEFLNNIERLIEIETLTIPDNSITKTSQLPDWLVNNAGWWAARIITDSDFDFDPGYVNEELYPCIELSTDVECFTRTINSHGFRGDEFQNEKPDNVFRIFAVGGSTTNGAAADDDKTWPAQLQKIANEKTTGKKIEVINAGIPGADSIKEYNMIKDKIPSLDPDLVIVYDGWNDFQHSNQIKKTIQNWESICKLGNNEGFDTIIVVQPLVITGHRVPTDQEATYGFSILTYLEKSQQYVDAFEELDNVCTKTVDFRGIFDYVQEPIFYDTGHTMSFGNEIIAKNFVSVISPIYFEKTYSVTQNDLQLENNKPVTGVVYAVGADLSGKNFDNLNLQNAVFDKADLSNTSFKNANINGARFSFANLDNSNLLIEADLSGANLSGVNLSGANLSGMILTNVDLSGVNLSSANLPGVDLSGKDLTGTILRGANLSNTILTDVDLSGKDLSGTTLTNVDLFGMDFTDTILEGARLSGIDLSGMDLTGTILTGADLSNTILTDVDLSGKDLTGTTLTNIDLSGMDFTDTILEGAHLSGIDLSNAILINANLENVTLENVKLLDANLDSANLSNADLRFILLVDANLSNATLTGADLTGAILTGAILSGADLENAVLTNAILNCVSHPICIK